MKYTVTLLVVLGIVAAVSAVFLVQMMRATMTSDYKTGPVEVVRLKHDLPAMTVLTSDAVELTQVEADAAPKDYLSSPVQAVGRILSKPAVAQQVLTEHCLITEGSQAQLAAALPAGMRAVSVALANNSVSGGLLYPGCVVDVLVTFKLIGRTRSDVAGEAISTTLLHGVQVLAVQGESVISQPESTAGEKISPKSNLSSSQRISVVLLVDPKQAEALQLAMDNGSVSLALRNPLDQQETLSEATVLNRGQLSKLGSLLGTTVEQARPAVFMADPLEDGIMIGDGTPAETAVLSERAPEPSAASWGVTVIRGNEIGTEEFQEPPVRR